MSRLPVLLTKLSIIIKYISYLTNPKLPLHHFWSNCSVPLLFLCPAPGECRRTLPVSSTSILSSSPSCVQHMVSVPFPFLCPAPGECPLTLPVSSTWRLSLNPSCVQHMVSVPFTFLCTVLCFLCR